MSLKQAIGIVLGFSAVFSLLNVISLFVWYRMNLPTRGIEMLSNPPMEAFVINLGTSITLGFFAGAVVGLILVGLFIWKELAMAKINASNQR